MVIIVIFLTFNEVFKKIIIIFYFFKQINKFYKKYKIICIYKFYIYVKSNLIFIIKL